MTDSKKPALYLLSIRHGETQDNIDRILQGHRDTSLTEKGFAEAEVLAHKMKDQHIDVIYHSPLIRIVQTIDPLLKTRPDIQTYPDNDLKGQCLGELEGKSYDTIDMSSPRSADGQPGVEPFEDFVKRLQIIFGRVVGRESPKVGENDRIVGIATHGVGITTLFKTLEATPNGEGSTQRLAVRGPDVYEVRWTDSDDVARLRIDDPADLPIENGVLDWSALRDEAFYIEYWGKKERAI